MGQNIWHRWRHGPRYLSKLGGWGGVAYTRTGPGRPPGPSIYVPVALGLSPSRWPRPLVGPFVVRAWAWGGGGGARDNPRWTRCSGACALVSTWATALWPCPTPCPCACPCAPAPAPALPLDQHRAAAPGHPVPTLDAHVPALPELSLEQRCIRRGGGGTPPPWAR